MCVATRNVLFGSPLVAYVLKGIYRIHVTRSLARCIFDGLYIRKTFSRTSETTSLFVSVASK